MINEIISNYKILKQIGSGGMGTVYLAQHTTLERYAAVKVLNPEYSNNKFFKDRFLNEATTLAKLNHPNIVILYDFIEYEGKLLIIMEYAEGQTLDLIINQNTFKDKKYVVKVISQVLDGLSYAHKQNVIHRDIKPSNIIIGENNISKILDFGIAKLTNTNLNLTKTGTRMGSVCYMSPEQILGKEVDLRSDIYSVGITLYELMTGNNPYNNDTLSDYEIQTRIINAPLIHNNDDIPENMRHVVNKATAKLPEERYSSCEEFNNELVSTEYFNPLKTNSTVETSDFGRKTKLISNIQNIERADNKQKENNKYLIPIFLGIAVILFGIAIFYLTSLDNDIDTGSKKNVTKTEAEIKKQVENVPEKKIINKTNSQSEAEKEEIKSTVNNLLNSWENMDVNSFFSNLTNDYKYESVEGVRRNYSERRNKAYDIFSKNKFINISTSDMTIDVADNYAEVRYRQKYNSTTVNESTIKKLYLRKEDNRWKVYKELSGFN